MPGCEASCRVDLTCYAGKVKTSKVEGLGLPTYQVGTLLYSDTIRPWDLFTGPVTLLAARVHVG